MAATTEELRILITAQDQASRVLQGLGRQMSTTMVAVQGAIAGASAAIVTRGLSLIEQAFKSVTFAVVGFSASLEQSRIAWETMLGGAAQAQAMLSQLQRFARETPFEFPDVERAARRMTAMGFAARDIIPLLTDIGNAASALGLGTEGVDRISLALGQMRTRTKVSAEDMLQLTEVGVPAWQILARATGQSIAQIQDSAAKGVIPAQTFIDAFRRFSQANYGGLMERQSRTFVGAMSNIRDSLTQLGAEAFEPMFNQLRDLAVAFADFLQSPGARQFVQWVRFLTDISSQLRTHFVEQFGASLQVIAAGWEIFANLAITAMNAVGEAWVTFWQSEIGVTEQSAFQELIEVARIAWTVWVDLATQAIKAVLEVWNGFVGLLLAMKLNDIPLPPTLEAIAGKFVDATEAAANFQNTMRNLPDILVGPFQAIKKFVSEDVWQAIQDAWQKAGASLEDTGEDIGKKTGMAFGQGMVQAVKPLFEELQRMLAQLRAAPIQAALEDTQAAIERDKLLLQIRGLPVEARTQARREIRELTRNVLPLQQLEAFDVGRDVTVAQRAEAMANLRNQILQTQIALAGGATGGATAVGIAAATGGGLVAPAASAPTTTSYVNLHIEVTTDGGAPQIYDELIEANGQAQTPPTIQISAVRRSGPS